MRRPYSLALLCILFLPAHGSAKDRLKDFTLGAQVAEVALDNAQVRHDRARLLQMVDAAYVLVKSNGARVGRTAFVDTMSSEALQLKPFKTSDVLATQIDGEVAILTGLMTMSGTENGRAFSESFHFSDVWRIRDRQWRIIFTQISAIPKS